MAKRKKKKKNSKILVILTIILLAFLYGLLFDEINASFGLMYDDANEAITTTINKNDNKTNTKPNIDFNNENELKIYYLDVGQADSILIQNNNDYMLIDAGNNNDGPLLVKYFNELNIKKFKYLVGTHPHEDHIGGMDDIINNFDIDTIYIPDAITTTKTFEDVLDAMENKNLTYSVPTIDNIFKLGNATFRIIYTGTNVSDLNNTSIILKMTYGETSYLFTGDTTDVTEKKVLNKDIQADVLKVGHHGSKYSSTDNFIKKVNPKYAIISVGKNNIYNHPATTTIDKLNNMNIKVYRTDELGTILLETNGKKIKISNFETNTNGG